jgi:hypothetical protein
MSRIPVDNLQPHRSAAYLTCGCRAEIWERVFDLAERRMEHRQVESEQPRFTAFEDRDAYATWRKSTQRLDNKLVVNVAVWHVRDRLTGPMQLLDVGGTERKRVLVGLIGGSNFVELTRTVLHLDVITKHERNFMLVRELRELGRAPAVGRPILHRDKACRRSRAPSAADRIWQCAYSHDRGSGTPSAAGRPDQEALPHLANSPSQKIPSPPEAPA